jgi:hypothetical protein
MDFRRNIMETMTLPLAYSEVVNKNDYMIPKGVLKRAFERSKEQMEMGILPVLPRYEDYTSIPLNEVIGKVNSVDLEKLEGNISIQPEYNMKGLVLGFMYLATDMEEKDNVRIINDVTIMYATILPEENSAY